MKRCAVTNHNCVAETRGGEQWNVNGQSVTLFVPRGGHRELDSVGEDGRACERCAKPVAEGQPLWHPKRGMEESPAIFGHPADGWRQNGRKTRHRNQGDRLGNHGVHATQRPKNRPRRSQSTHSSDEASNDRGAKGVQEDGRALDPTTDHKPLRVPARAVPQRSQPSTRDLAGTVRRGGGLGDHAQSVLSLEEPIDWRAVCGKSACTVRREGWRSNRHPYPYHFMNWSWPQFGP